MLQFEVMDAIKDAGYQVLDLAHNHILDSQLEGVISTADTIEKAGIITYWSIILMSHVTRHL